MKHDVVPAGKPETIGIPPLMFEDASETPVTSLGPAADECQAGDSPQGPNEALPNGVPNWDTQPTLAGWRNRTAGASG